VFVNVVGGVRVDEPGCDLAVALAVASASRGVPAASPPGGARGAPRACFGELGLTGELRWVGHPERRLEEAAKHGLSAVIAPMDSGGAACEVATLRDALAAGLPTEQGRPARAVAQGPEECARAAGGPGRAAGTPVRAAGSS
jgi:DNA repair protein RadA/Sms